MDTTTKPDTAGAFGQNTPATMAEGLARMLAMPALANASPDLRNVVRWAFMTGGWLAYSIQTLAVRQVMESPQPDQAARLLHGLAKEMQAFDEETERALLVTAAGQVH